MIHLDAGADSTVELYDTRKDWLAVRRSAIGASEAPVLLGLVGWKSAMQLFAEKLELIEQDAENDAMRWGRILEAPVADHYEATTGRLLHDPGQFTLRRSRAIPFMVATLDREIISGTDTLGTAIPAPAPLEIKTAGVYRTEEWADEPPLPVQVQVQHQLAVTGWKWASIAVLIGGRDFRWFDVPRHEAFIAALIQAEAKFYERLSTKTPPQPDGTDATREVLRALYPKEQPGLVVTLPGEAIEWDAQRLEALAELKRWQGVKDTAENQLRAALGDAEIGVCTNGVTYTLRAAERKGYVVHPMTVRTLRRKEAK